MTTPRTTRHRRHRAPGARRAPPHRRLLRTQQPAASLIYSSITELIVDSSRRRASQRSGKFNRLRYHATGLLKPYVHHPTTSLRSSLIPPRLPTHHLQHPNRFLRSSRAKLCQPSNRRRPVTRRPTHALSLLCELERSLTTRRRDACSMLLVSHHPQPKPSHSSRSRHLRPANSTMHTSSRASDRSALRLPPGLTRTAESLNAEGRHPGRDIRSLASVRCQNPVDSSGYDIPTM